MRLFIFLSSLLIASAASFGAPPAKPTHQYLSGDIAISLPSSNEPKVKAFDASSIKAAAKYLDDGSLCWVREKSCINCHTTGPYMSERPALSPKLGAPQSEVLENFVKSIPKIIVQKEVAKDGLSYYPGSYSSVWRSLGLAEWDKHVTGKLSATTDEALREMFSRQSSNGAFVSFGEVEIPHITTDFELTLQAARAITAAPDWLTNIKDEQLKDKIEKMKQFLRDAPPRNDYDRVLHLQLASYLPELVSQENRDAALALLSSKQHPDGGWSLRDMSALQDWHYNISETVLKLITGLPDAAQPTSDAYMTAFAIVLMRQSGIPSKDNRLQKGIAWLKREQRESGRWWMQSLYRGNYHYSTYIATCQALKALSMCGEL
jgi:squalene-hopene/tetraprenyl-beta-curcumene cyclase